MGSTVGRIIVAALIVHAGSAQAVVDPCYADAVIARASSVIQVVNFTVTAPDDANGCTIAGEVGRVLRGRQFHVGDKVETRVACAGNRDVLCGSIWYDPAEIMAAGAIEIHVEREGDELVGAESVLLLPEMTEEIVWRSACGN